MAGWANDYWLLREELIQLRDENVEVPQEIHQKVASLDAKKDAWNAESIGPIFDALDRLARDPELEKQEPSDLASIKALRPSGARVLQWAPTEKELLDRLHGAWTGRATGCALGKPVEGIGMSFAEGKPSGRMRIKLYLQDRNDWPLRDYFSGRETGDGEQIGAPRSQREGIEYMEPDDDIHYTLVGLGVLEESGPNFDWTDVAYFWTDRIPFSAICTAETQAILNFWNNSLRWKAPGNAHTDPSFTRRHRNPYREWIGAQIRADGWAYACAGKPELAAEMAYRDASWTHEKNGIYGEMFFAAAIAAAFVEHEPSKIIEIALSEIPRECRLARAIRRTVDICQEAPDWESAITRVEELCREFSPSHIWMGNIVEGMNPVHTINNACICVVALLFGNMDTVNTQAIAVMCGLDTDCNGATVGSIVGAATGKSRFRPELAAPLNDTIRPSMIGFEQVSMRDLAKRTLAQWKRVDAYAQGR